MTSPFDLPPIVRIDSLDKEREEIVDHLFKHVEEEFRDAEAIPDAYHPNLREYHQQLAQKLNGDLVKQAKFLTDSELQARGDILIYHHTSSGIKVSPLGEEQLLEGRLDGFTIYSTLAQPDYTDAVHNLRQNKPIESSRFMPWGIFFTLIDPVIVDSDGTRATTPGLQASFVMNYPMRLGSVIREAEAA